MAKRTVKKGSTSRIEYLVIDDTSSTTGGKLTGLVYNSAGLAAYYIRPGAAPVAITLATQTATGAFSSGGFVEVSSSNAPGLYRLDVPDAAFASGVDSVIVCVKGATNMAPTFLEYDLTAYDPTDAVRLGLTALPNANANASGGLMTYGTGTGQINPSSGAVAIAGPFKKNTAFTGFMFVLRDSTTHAPKTGQASNITLQRSIDAGAFAAGTIGAISELGSTGVYYCNLGAGDLNGTQIMLRGTCSAADDFLFGIWTTP